MHLGLVIRHDESGLAAAVEVGERGSHPGPCLAVGRNGDAGEAGDLGERAVAPVVEQEVGVAVVGDEHVGQAVVVDVRDGDAEAVAEIRGDAAGLADVLERPFPVLR